MKKLISVLLLVVFVFSLSGCKQGKYPDLPDDAVAFVMGEYIDEEDDNASYGTIEYEGRTYMPYGTIDKTISAQDIDTCLGYLLQDVKEDKDRRLYTLVQDKEHNFLIDSITGISLMEQPMFWRAVDTKGRDITIPDYIDSLEYSFWK